MLNEAPLPFRYRVFTGGVLLFSRDEGLRAGVVDETVRNYLDWKRVDGKPLEVVEASDQGWVSINV